MKEEVVKLNVKDISDFPKHPFKINNDLNYEELKNSIIESGVLVPTIVRKKEDGKYEMLSGHRRKKICEEQGIKKIPCIVKDVSDEESIILMIDSNLQRDKILPSEKALAYKMKYEAIKHQGKTSDPLGSKLSIEDIVKDTNDSATQIRRYIRLNYLIPELLQLVDDTVLKDKRATLTMGLRPAVELSYLSKDDQELVYEEITYEDLTPSHVQAKRIRELTENGFEFKTQKLEGVIFGLYALEDIVWNGRTIYTKDTLIAEKVTDSDGKIVFDDLYLGKYYVKEIETLDNYVLDEKQYETELVYKDQYTPTIFYSEALLNVLKTGKLEFTKTDISESKTLPNTLNRNLIQKEKSLLSKKIKEEYYHFQIIEKDNKTVIEVHNENPNLNLLQSLNDER